MPPLDSKIDDLYRGPLKEFVAGRAALAKTLAGDEAKRVKGLPKPTVAPWAVNQVYWHARPVYDRLAASGEKLRDAQIAALKGKASDVRRATEAHRKAMGDAVTEALRLASGGGAKPSADELTRTLEAVSLARDLPEPPGRLTKALRPAGFEALAGVPVKAVRPAASTAPGVRPRAPLKLVEDTRFAERTREAEDRQRKKAIGRATASVARAKTAEARARAAWEHAKQTLAAAELAFASLQRT